MYTSPVTRDAGEHDAPGAALVEGQALTKSYDRGHPERLALRGVDLAVEPGEMVAIMGPSGCGKSTLLHLLGGLDVPTDGAVLLGGRRLDTLSETKRALVRRREVGYVFQFFNLIANLSVADNVELPQLLVGRPPAHARARREELLGRLGLAGYGSRAPAELSGGEQQRVALARALANEPAVLLADEPSDGRGRHRTRAGGDAERHLPWREAHRLQHRQVVEPLVDAEHSGATEADESARQHEQADHAERGPERIHDGAGVGPELGASAPPGGVAAARLGIVALAAGIGAIVARRVARAPVAETLRPE